MPLAIGLQPADYTSRQKILLQHHHMSLASVSEKHRKAYGKYYYQNPFPRDLSFVISLFSSLMRSINVLNVSFANAS